METETVYGVWGVYSLDEEDATPTLLSLHRSQETAEKWGEENRLRSWWTYKYTVEP